MFRPTVLLNAASKAATLNTTRFAPVACRFYSAGLNKSDVEVRVLDVLKGFDKVDESKVTIETNEKRTTNSLFIFRFLLMLTL
jgi:NADH dehydrogenase (ubiquinone) 1 alpha/beta subcomplex 1